MAKQKTAAVYKDVPGDPVKSFFVEMMTRDISLEDSILDLLDNCVDGVLRSTNRTRSKKPYEGYHAQIFFDGDGFEISDNCGGIPWGLRNYAFRLGKANNREMDDRQTVGYYGIGMKRAIFKIGQDSLIQTKNKKDSYEVEITNEWMKDEDNWRLPVSQCSEEIDEDGTTVLISHLRPDIRRMFTKEKMSFEASLKKKIATHYAFIISKGFDVYVNDNLIKPKATSLRFEAGSGPNKLQPFIYEDHIDGVDVFLAVGFTKPIMSSDDIERETEDQQHTSEMAGWTVVCNDRAVLYANTDELTGWGEATVPKYHTQFTAIAGIVEFRSNHAAKLPTNTTKRGIDANSLLYLQVKNKMREGMKMFTSYTNKWKGPDLSQTAKDRIRKAPSKTFAEIKAAAPNLKMKKIRGKLRAKQHKPKLPMPKPPKDKRISFTRPISEIEELGEYLFDDPAAKPSDIGEKCFDSILDKAR